MLTRALEQAVRMFPCRPSPDPLGELRCLLYSGVGYYFVPPSCLTLPAASGVQGGGQGAPVRRAWAVCSVILVWALAIASLVPACFDWCNAWSSL